MGVFTCVQEAYLLRTMTHSAVMGLISGRDFVDLIVNINDETLVGTFGKVKRENKRKQEL